MAETGEQKGTKKSKSVVFWAVSGLLFLLLAGDLTLRAIAYFKPPRSEASAQGASGRDAAKSSDPAKPVRPEVKSTVALEPFLVNLADKDSARFVKATFHLGMTDEKGGEAFSSDRAAVAATRDSIISLLTVLTSDQVLSPEGKAKLREEIRKRVNSLSRGRTVQEVYIVDFVIQL